MGHIEVRLDKNDKYLKEIIDLSVKMESELETFKFTDMNYSKFWSSILVDKDGVIDYDKPLDSVLIKGYLALTKYKEELDKIG